MSRSAALIAFRSVFSVVAPAVDLDGEPRLGAIKIEHVGPDRMLPSKRWASRRAGAEFLES